MSTFLNKKYTIKKEFEFDLTMNDLNNKEFFDIAYICNDKDKNTSHQRDVFYSLLLLLYKDHGCHIKNY